MSIKPEDEKREFLYKYRPLIGVSESHINENTLRLLENGELFFSKPSQFNDPFDSRIDYDTSANETELRAFFSKLSMQHGNSLDIDFIIDQINTGKINKADFVKKDDLSDSNNIFCLSKDEKSILMWSHYAKDHTGICIGFKVHKSCNSMNIKIKSGYAIPIPSFDSNLLPVSYINYSTDKPKPYNHFIHEQKELIRHFITKSKLWEYEQEVRIILHEKQILSNPICLEAIEIGEIIFGLKTPPILIEKVKQIVKNYPDNGSHIKLCRCVEIKGQYAINKEQI
jgi:hypothetical protein